MRVVTGPHAGNVELLPRICCDSCGDCELPFILRRHQFPVKPAWVITINKSQGQSISGRLGIYLPAPVFAHGQLYVAYSRGSSFQTVRCVVVDSGDDRQTRVPGESPTQPDRCFTTNIVDRQLLRASQVSSRRSDEPDSCETDRPCAQHADPSSSTTNLPSPQPRRGFHMDLPASPITSGSRPMQGPPVFDADLKTPAPTGMHCDSTVSDDIGVEEEAEGAMEARDTQLFQATVVPHITFDESVTQAAGVPVHPTAATPPPSIRDGMRKRPLRRQRRFLPTAQCCSTACLCEPGHLTPHIGQDDAVRHNDTCDNSNVVLPGSRDEPLGGTVSNDMGIASNCASAPPPPGKRRHTSVLKDWTIQNHASLPTPSRLNPLPVAPTWYNDARTAAVTRSGVQVGSTCGLHAFNHAFAACCVARSVHFDPVSRAVFEATALEARVGDRREALVDQANGNYDVAVLTTNCAARGIGMFPLTPEEIQERLFAPFQPHHAPAHSSQAAAYIIGLPSHGGHWVAILPGSVPSGTMASSCDALMCDSMHSTPHAMTVEDVTALLTICAHEQAFADAHGGLCEWRCFLVCTH